MLSLLRLVTLARQMIISTYSYALITAQICKHEIGLFGSIMVKRTVHGEHPKRHASEIATLRVHFQLLRESITSPLSARGNTRHEHTFFTAKVTSDGRMDNY